MPNEFDHATVLVSLTGLNGGGVTAGQLAAALAGLAPSNAKYVTLGAEAGLSNEASLGAVGTGIIKSTVTGGVAVLTPAVGADLPAHNHAGVVQSVSFPLNEGGSAIAAGIKYIDVYVPVAVTLTGWAVGASASSTIAFTVLRALAATPSSYATISAASSPNKPQLAGAFTNSQASMTGWTTSLAAGDRLRIDVDASPTPTSVLATITLLFTRSI